MFIKLLATNMVANSFLGRSNRLKIISIRLDLASNLFSISDRVSENKATSEPEISAENSRSKNNKTKPKTTETSIAIIKLLKLVGSGSKYVCFSYT